MIKAILFDRDGVLVDSNESIIFTYQMTGKVLGLKVPKKEFFRKSLGITYPTILKRAYGKDKKILETYNKMWYVGKNRIKPKKMSGFNNAMKKIKLKKAIVTSGSMHATKTMLKDSLKYFQFVVTRADTKNHKPNAEPLLLACKKLRIKPKEAVYVGDSVIDYKTARNAGMKFIGFLSNGSTKKEFEKTGVKVTVKSLNELTKIIEKF
jgi:phosphoglycolate phosphatase